METNVRQALHSVQQTLNAPKNKHNSFGKYNYRSCEDILAAAKPLLAEVGATLTLQDEIVQVGERIYVRATATFAVETGEVQTTAFAREAERKSGMDDAQITGSASSYARKYALNGLFAIDDIKDPDTNEYHDQTTQSRVVQRQHPKSQSTATIPVNEAMKSVQASVKAAQTVTELVTLYQQLKEQDKDLAELMQDEFTRRKKEIQNL